MSIGFWSVPNLVPWLIIIAWIVTDQFCWITLHLHLSGGGGGWLFEGDDYFKHIRSRGVIVRLREAINRGRAIIWGERQLESTALIYSQFILKRCHDLTLYMVQTFHLWDKIRPNELNLLLSFNFEKKNLLYSVYIVTRRARLYSQYSFLLQKTS